MGTHVCLGTPGRQRGAMIHLGILVCDGVRHTQWIRWFGMVTFGVHIREKGCTTKEGSFVQQEEKY
jgi:ribosomal protein L27